MANSVAARGLKPIRHRNGAPYNGGGSLYHVSSTYATAIAPGDPVTVTGTADANGIPTVARTAAGAGNATTGVVIGRTNGQGTLLQSDALELPASTGGYLLVEDNPDVVFEVQMDGAFAVTDISNNTNYTAAAASSLDFSGFEASSTRS